MNRRWMVDIRALAIPPDDWVTIQPGPVDASTLSVLQERGYDQAPVVARATASAIGLVETAYLRQLAEYEAPLHEDDETIRAPHHFLKAAGEVEVIELLSALTTTRAVLVVDPTLTDEIGQELEIGLVTISDLNRHPVRASLYSVIAGLELELARVVPHLFPDPWSWIEALDEPRQVEIVGHWELTRRRGVDVNPVAATTLTQLLRIVARDKAFLARLGLRSRGEFDRQTGHIATLRNCVMHPVRPLVLDQAGVARVHETVGVMIDLIERIGAMDGTAMDPRTCRQAAGNDP
jgi:hypothetical protein